MTPKFEHPVSDSTKIRSIEGLRVVALAVFVAWLVQLQPFHGGYVGLDVFFVIALLHVAEAGDTCAGDDTGVPY